MVLSGRTQISKKLVKNFYYFVTLGKLKPNERFLDVGCGSGRMAVPLVSYLEGGNYEGFDINSEGIKWCKENIQSKHPNFKFRQVDIYNQHYNNKGKYKASEFKFPYENEMFDFISLTSVFTHLVPHDLENYLSEIVRVLKINGRCLITYFLLNSQSCKSIEKKTVMVNFRHEMDGYTTVNKTDPERAIAYDEKVIRNLYQKYNLELIEPIYYGTWSDRKDGISAQDIIISVKK